MQHHRVRALLVLAFCVALATPPLHAQSETAGERNPISIGAGAGIALTDQKNDDRFKGDVRNTPLSFRGFVGYRLHRYLGVEAGYVSFGTTEFDGTWEAEPGSPVEDKGEITGGGAQIAAIGVLPLSGPMSLLAKVGMNFWSLTEQETYGGYPEERDASGSTPFVGAGAEVDLIDMFGLRLEWDYYFKVGEKDETGEGANHTVTLDAILRLGG